jgi:hypothetical protein
MLFTLIVNIPAVQYSTMCIAVCKSSGYMHTCMHAVQYLAVLHML